MFSPSLTTVTGKVVDRIEAWSAPWANRPRGPQRVSMACVSVLGLLGVGTFECLMSGIQLILCLAVAFVKQALRLLHLKTLAQQIPNCSLTTQKTLAHKTAALALQVLVGTLLIPFYPAQVAHVYDLMGLKRSRIWSLARELHGCSEQASAIARQIPTGLILGIKGGLWLFYHQPILMATATSFLAWRINQRSDWRSLLPSWGEPQSMGHDGLKFLFEGEPWSQQSAEILPRLAISAIAAVLLAAYREQESS